MEENHEITEFDAAIDYLSAFTDDFSSNELSNQLIRWIHDDLGINKKLAQLMVKQLVPWVLARAKNPLKKRYQHGC